MSGTARLPLVGGDINAWGGLINTFLGVAHNTDGSIKNLFINVKDPAYGAMGDGVTDDTAALQAAYNAAVAGSIIFHPPGVYLITATLLYLGNCRLWGVGDADGGTIIRVKTGTALTTPILASKDWWNNTATCGNPVEISDIKLDANSATSGSAAHGLVAYNFWSSFDNISISGPTGDGFLFTAQSKNNTHISNTCVEAKIRRLQVRSAGQNGIHIQDNGSGLNSCTDGFCEDCIVQNAGTRAILCEMGPGWYFAGNHIYGSVTDGIYVQKCYATRVHGNYIDGYGSGSSTYIAGIGMECIDGRASSCIGNHVGFESGAATGPYQAIHIIGKGSGTTICIVTNNSVIGGSQSGSLAYVYEAQGTQVGHPFYIYSHDNDSQAVATRLYQDTNTTGGDLIFIGHIGSEGQNAPTGAAGANAGSSPPSPVLTHCTDTAGKVTFGTGTGPAAGAQCVITFNVTFANAPIVVITPINSASASLTLYVTSTTTTFTVSCVTAPSASQANTVYGFMFHVFAC